MGEEAFLATVRTSEDEKPSGRFKKARLIL